jgi:hypothetical protein
VPDVCCSISVNAVGLPAVVAFENAVTQYKAACHPICPAIACKVVPSNTCDGTTSECR